MAQPQEALLVRRAALLERRSLIRSGTLVVGSSVAIALVNTLALRLYTELAPARTFGEFNLVQTALMLGTQLFVAPFTNTQLRYQTEAQASGAAGAFTREALHWSLCSASVLGAIACFACLFCGRLGGPKLGFGVAAASVAWVCATTVRNVFMGRLQAEQRRLLYGSLAVLEALALVLTTVIALHVRVSTSSFLIGQVAAPVALVLVGSWIHPWTRLRRTASHTQRTEFRRRAVQYGLPFAPAAIGAWLSNLADRYVLGLLMGAAAVGQYVAPAAIASRAMILLNGTLNDFFRPMLFDAENRGERRRARSVFLSWIGVSAAVGCAAVAVVVLAGSIVIRVLLASEYRTGAVPIMAWIAVGYGVYGVTQVFETRLLSLGRSAQLIATMAAGAVANLALSALLIPRHGTLGAAQASCLSFLVQSLATAAFLVRAEMARVQPR
jgi:O-antigen/teichoic acid export membrane protein